MSGYYHKHGNSSIASNLTLSQVVKDYVHSIYNDMLTGALYAQSIT
jgi:hypothetical protein